jgi:hypothetical protein
VILLFPTHLTSLTAADFLSCEKGPGPTREKTPDLNRELLAIGDLSVFWASRLWSTSCNLVEPAPRSSLVGSKLAVVRL